jgi:hypothetical protein
VLDLGFSFATAVIVASFFDKSNFEFEVVFFDKSAFEADSSFLFRLNAILFSLKVIN